MEAEAKSDVKVTMKYKVIRLAPPEENDPRAFEEHVCPHCGESYWEQK